MFSQKKLVQHKQLWRLMMKGCHDRMQVEHTHVLTVLMGHLKNYSTQKRETNVSAIKVVMSHQFCFSRLVITVVSQIFKGTHCLGALLVVPCSRWWLAAGGETNYQRLSLMKGRAPAAAAAIVATYSVQNVCTLAVVQQ